MDDQKTSSEYPPPRFSVPEEDIAVTIPDPDRTGIAPEQRADEYKHLSQRYMSMAASQHQTLLELVGYLKSIDAKLTVGGSVAGRGFGRLQSFMLWAIVVALAIVAVLDHLHLMK